MLIRNRPHPRVNSGGSMYLQIQLSGRIDEPPENNLKGHLLLQNVIQDVARTFRREITSTEVR